MVERGTQKNNKRKRQCLFVCLFVCLFERRFFPLLLLLLLLFGFTLFCFCFSKILWGNFLALLVVGSLARMVGNILVAIFWQWAVLKKVHVTIPLHVQVHIIWLSSTLRHQLRGRAISGATCSAA